MGNDRFDPEGEQGKDLPLEQMRSGDENNQTNNHDASDELERQARETMRAFRESAGELGARVRQVMSRTSELWAQATPTAETGGRDPSGVPPADELRARALARRWIAIDFLVDPELAESMGVTALHNDAVWRVDLIERGETRSLADATEPYAGNQPGALGPILPVWDYSFPAVPEIESGERRERLPATDALVACERCNGTGHRPCAECEGKGFLPCPKCHGRARVPCRRCRGRGMIADDSAERRARAGQSYLQVHAERLANDAAGRLADFAERLRQEHGVPLPPSAQWAPVAPASGITMPCPECTDGYIACECRSGKTICDVCLGSGQAECKRCGATGRVVRHRELVRRFDTRITERVVPPAGPEVAEWLARHSLRRLSGETAWEGDAETVQPASVPQGVPQSVWAVACELAQAQARMLPGDQPADQGERRVLSRQLRLLRVPFIRVEYTFAGQPLEFAAVGRSGAERFWAHTFPARWTRVGRFLRAVMRDLATERPERPPSTERANGELTTGEISTLAEYRSRRMRQPTHRVRIIAEEDDTDQAPPDASAPNHVPPGDAHSL